MWSLQTCPLLGDGLVSLTCDFLSHHGSLGAPVCVQPLALGHFQGYLSSVLNKDHYCASEGQFLSSFPSSGGVSPPLTGQAPSLGWDPSVNGTDSADPLLPPVTAQTSPDL